MSERRTARARRAVDFDPERLPERLAAGPCIEDWTTDADEDPHAQWNARAYTARARWRDAVMEWAERVGWERPGHPRANVLNLARTRHPWSRVFLIGRGETDLVDYLEGRRASNPRADDEPPRWRPSY